MVPVLAGQGSGGERQPSAYEAVPSNPACVPSERGNQVGEHARAPGCGMVFFEGSGAAQLIIYLHGAVNAACPAELACTSQARTVGVDSPRLIL